MPEIGQTISHYRIIEKLGQGGMGVVYRAEDTTLGRQVAIKVLPDVFAGDAERLARFEREAKLLASLNHPNIATIHGLEEAEGKRFIVLELVEGDTLAERLKNGPLPVSEALDVCRQIAEGLEAAHEKGIIHRDLKPANVKITSEGKVKVLDFGLAKAFQEEPVDDKSPTISECMTRPGVMLGTAAYMSPEQAKGKHVDRRADIWAFGCVLYECLTGRRPFRGDSVTDVIAKILESEPDWSGLPETAPAQVGVLLRRCLHKDRKYRLHDIADARIELDEALRKPPATEPIRPLVPSRPNILPVVAVGTVALILGILAGSLILQAKRPAREPTRVTRFSIDMPVHEGIGDRAHDIMALSPDGSHLAYVAENQLLLRSMDSVDPLTITISEKLVLRLPSTPFFSPDGKWLGFYAGYKLLKVPVAGGSQLSICDCPGDPLGSHWASQETVVFGRGQGGIFHVAPVGGEAKVLVAADTAGGEILHGPQLLKNGEWVLFSVHYANRGWRESQIVVQSTAQGTRKTLVSGATEGRYLDTGHLVYVRDNTLWAIPFSEERIQPFGQPAAIVRDIGQDPSTGFAVFSVSGNGTLAYVSGRPSSRERTLVWVDRNGNATRAVKGPGNFLYHRLSPDGQRVAVSLGNDTAGFDLWVYDLTGATPPFPVAKGGCNLDPVWTPDGQRIIFSRSAECYTSENLYWVQSDGTGKPELLLERVNRQYPYSISSDGRLLFYCDFQGDRRDIWVLSLEGERSARSIFETDYRKWWPAISPDGLWIAYSADATGDQETWVASYPDMKIRRRISFSSGRQPWWSKDGRELYYQEGRKLLSVAADTRNGRFGQPRPLFELGNWVGPPAWPTFDVTPDGRFLLCVEESAQSGEKTPAQIIVVLNWFEELKRLCPTRR